MDPLWLPTDAGLALAWRENKGQHCSGCGTRPDEWEHDPDAYIGDVWTCEGCARLAMERANNLAKDAEDKPLPGQHVYLKRRPPDQEPDRDGGVSGG